MPGDYTRFTFKPAKRYSSVRMQQGRVQLDSDWNEQSAIWQRRWRLQAIDTLGRCAVPKATTPDAFRIRLAAPPLDLEIGVGRAYVNGLLAEILEGESFQGNPITYLNQPFLPQPPALGGNGIVYLDVRQREVTYLQDPDLLEKALGGPDTTTRLQTVWQVKFEPLDNPACGLDLDTLFPPSGGRLTTSASAPPGSDDPCVIDPAGGFRGLENRLYRVQIHQGGAVGTALFKWSRDNASVVSIVQQINTDTITVSRIGRDKVLRFREDDWVEVTDDRRELMGQAGAMAQVTKVTESSLEIQLDRDISGEGFDSGDAERHTRVIRWDQRQGVNSDGLMTTAASVNLPDGVQLGFTQQSGVFDPGDYWVFAARTADGSVEELQQAPPRGIVHHYCQLAALTDPQAFLDGEGSPQVRDCRPVWPGNCCCCTVEVGEGGEYRDIATALRDATDRFGASRPLEICLLPGEHQMDSTILIRRNDVTIKGCGRAARVFAPPDQSAFIILGHRFALKHVFLTADARVYAIRCLLGDDHRLEGNEIENESGPVMQARRVERLRVVYNRLTGTRGVVAQGNDLLIAHNRMTGRGTGSSPGEAGLIDLQPSIRDAQVLENRLNGGGGSGISLGGPSNSAKDLSTLIENVRIAGNTITRMSGSGIAVPGLPERFPPDPRLPDSLPPLDARFEGTLTDQTGAVLPGVEVTATDQASGQVVTTVTDAEGRYAFSGLTRGEFLIESPLEGFEGVRFQPRASGTATFDFQVPSRAPVDLPPFTPVISIPQNLWIESLRIEGNTIRHCALPQQGAAGGMAPQGGIVLSLASRLLIRDNLIEDNGADPSSLRGAVGIFAQDCKALIIHDNVIVGNGSARDGNALPGVQGGIVAQNLSAPAELLQVDIPGAVSSAVARPSGRSAASIQSNLVVAPCGLALDLRGTGPMQVLDNRFVSLCKAETADPQDPGSNIGAVWIQNQGMPSDLFRPLTIQGFRRGGVVQPPDFNLPQGLSTGGKVEFSNNQVLLQLARPLEQIGTAVVGIMSLDDTGVHDNQVEYTSGGSFFLFDAWVNGLLMRATGNGFHEGRNQVLFSLIALGKQLATGTSNQATHCILIQGPTAGATAAADNLTLNCSPVFRDFNLAPPAA